MNGKPAFPLRTAGFPIKVWIFKHIKNILNFDIMEMLHMNINVDQLLKELESVTITALDFNALLDWADALKETSAKNEKDAEMLVHVNNEIMRRSLERSGGLLS